MISLVKSSQLTELSCELLQAQPARQDLTCQEIQGSLRNIATLIDARSRVCERNNCPLRTFPALSRALKLDEHRSTISPYLVKHA